MTARKSTLDVHATKRERRSFAKIPEVMDVPSLLALQSDSFDWFKTEGLGETFRDISPIENPAGNLVLEFGDHEFGDVKYSADECKEKDISYQAPLFIWASFINKETGEVKEQQVFLGDFPLMTDRGTFIINGTERVVVSQLVRSPGIYFSATPDPASDRPLYSAKFIPARGAWLELEIDKRDVLYVRIDRKRKQPITVFLRALGIAETPEDVIELLGDNELVRRTLDRDTAGPTRADALVDIYRRQRPGEPPSPEAGDSLLTSLFFSEQRYDLAKVGRYKINKKLGVAVDSSNSTLTTEDILAAVRYIVGLWEFGESDTTGTEASGGGFSTDDIDHFGNRRIRTVGELIQNQFRIGLTRMERVVRERMSTSETDAITPQTLINIRPITASIKEFFGSSQLSQFMDQTNPVSGLTHKRRLNALGPGGLSRERAGFEVRDVHPSHYSRMCPIETPEGPNIGLIGSLATYARINPYGFIEAPYRKVVKGKVTDDIEYLTADEEENFIVAQANEEYDHKTGKFKNEMVLCRARDARGKFGEPEERHRETVEYMDISPRQMVSVATALIPFLEHDDANRALMGSNMQRQAVPLIRPAAPLVGTGLERRAVVDSGEIIVAKNAGVVERVDSSSIALRLDDSSLEEHRLPKFMRSNQGTCINHRPLVRPGDKVEPGDVLADGPSTDTGELALGQNLTVAFMPWEGYNYEDAIIISERIVHEDMLTSIHIAEYEIEARDTKLGPEEITREIPNIGEDVLGNLDSDGVIRIGAEVFPGDVLVGKVTPKGETEMTAEERLLRAIFGEKSREVRDTSLKVPHGSGGRVINVVRFSRDTGHELTAGVNELIRVYVAQKRKIQQGDKLAGRHGNKGVIASILPIEDMPFMADGTPVDIILNPLGVPSRMNIGQLLETHLGWAALHGWNDSGSDPVAGNMHVATPVFDGAKEDEIASAISASNANLIARAKAEYGDLARDEFVPQLSETGKLELFDGRTGEKFREPITVGTIYILKLLHLVDDKIHARSTGPYSLITQQPLGGKAQFGGQRFGEMEVWALYAYGASNVLQEILTVKSDDTAGRTKTYEAIVKGESIPPADIPESFKVLVKEMKSLALDVAPITDAGEELDADTEQRASEVATFAILDEFGATTEDTLGMITESLSGLEDLDLSLTDEEE